MMLETLREQVVFYGNEMLRQGLTLHTGGNVSARAGEYMVIKPSSVPYALIRPQDVTVMDREGNVLEGLPPSSEWRLHAALYRAFPWIGAVVHTHSPYACALAARGLEVPLVHQELCCYCGEPVHCAPFAQAGKGEVGEGAVAAMGQQNQVALLQNHGLVAMGRDLWQAMDAACAAEIASAMVCLGQTLGPCLEIPPEARAALYQRTVRRSAPGGVPPQADRPAAEG